MSATPPLHVREHGGHFVRAEAQVGHAGVLAFIEEGGGDRIALSEHLVGSSDVTDEPGAVPPCSHTRKVRPHLVALPNAVADAALALKEVFSLVEHERTRFRVTLPPRRILPTQKIRYRRGEELRVVDSGVAHPQPARLVADHEAGAVPVLADRVAYPGQTQLLGREPDVFVLAGEEEPARPDAVLLRIGLEHLGLVPLGIDGDRVEEDVLSHALAEKPLQLREPRGLERALVLATRIHDVDRNRLALEQIVVETNGGAVLRGQRDVRKVVRAPAIGCKRGARMQRDNRTGEQRRRDAFSVTASHGIQRLSTGRLDPRYWLFRS